MARNLNVRVYGVNKRINRILCIIKVIWKSDVAGIVSVFTTANF